MINRTGKIEDAQILAQAIVNTIPGPFVVLDESFNVLAASYSFYRVFKVDPERTRGAKLFALGDGQWDIPALRLLLEKIIPERIAMHGFEVEHDFPGVGLRVMLLDARKVVYEDSPTATILLAFRDITDQRAIEQEKEALFLQTEELLRQKDVLLREIEHRVANSLQIIASILLLKAKGVSSPETRQHLRDAHQRVMSVAAVQSHLHASSAINQVQADNYLTQLCNSLAGSMVSESHPIAIRVEAEAGTIDSAKAVSLGLIVTELVINCVKYAFPETRNDARIAVIFNTSDAGWKLMSRTTASASWRVLLPVALGSARQSWRLWLNSSARGLRQ
ncbi:histidine kinase [Sphingomonas glacialis]|uniref:histidine kinase n=1 Tax=Sphingomonas glacialis TaxID=658225 RepID=A0ABQ3LVI9_9SPHN|nr:PAS domain-containing sensor histidine kinase [Sphingomonas glacialis]GHH24588.1 histidine kinase [Sphingomonas glacialis]